MKFATLQKIEEIKMKFAGELTLNFITKVEMFIMHNGI